MNFKNFKLGIASILVVDLIWGLNTVMNKIGLNSLGIGEFIAIKSTIAVLALTPFVWRHFHRPSLTMVISSFVAGPVGFGLLYLGLSKTDASVAAVVGALDPGTYFILSVLMLGEAFSIRKVSGLLLAILGVIYITVVTQAGADFELSSLAGPGLYLFALALGTASALYVKKRDQKESISPMMMAWLIQLFNLMVFVPVLFLGEGIEVYSGLSGQVWFSIFYGAIGSMVVGVSLYYYAIEHIDGEDVGILRNIDPLIAVVAGFLILGETISAHFIFGAVVVFIGIMIAEFNYSHHSSKHHK